MRNERADLSPRPSTGRKRRILATAEERRSLWAQLERDCQTRLKRHCELWEEDREARLSVATISRAIRGLRGPKKIAGCQ
jgi:hypothetical protein